MDELTRLLQDAADGDRVALSAFVRRTQADVWRFCAHLVDPGAADDLTQEVYLRALRAAPRFRGESTARTWLLSIARRTAADEIRRRQRRRRLPSLTAPEAVPGLASDVELVDLVDGLEDLDQRTAFVLTQLLGFTYTEAAEACEVPVGTIRSRIARARRQLVERLDVTEDPAAGRG
jgi:RNA polymerase sigma-70 factor, ECF subfamily